MRTPKCPSCGGSGVERIDMNPSWHFDGTEDSCPQELVCGDCGGSGKDMKFLNVPHGHHVNPLAKERA